MKRILEILRADKDGRLFISSVSVGQTVFVPINDTIGGGWYILKEKVTAVTSDGRFLTQDDGTCWTSDDLGGDVFLTLEEARKAVEEAEKRGSNNG